MLRQIKINDIPQFPLVSDSVLELLVGHLAQRHPNLKIEGSDGYVTRLVVLWPTIQWNPEQTVLCRLLQNENWYYGQGGYPEHSLFFPPGLL